MTTQRGRYRNYALYERDGSRGIRVTPAVGDRKIKIDTNEMWADSPRTGGVSNKGSGGIKDVH